MYSAMGNTTLLQKPGNKLTSGQLYFNKWGLYFNKWGHPQYGAIALLVVSFSTAFCLFVCLFLVSYPNNS